ncbi:cupin domain-containing protein [Fructobacillus ficulneus]|uniref:Cupin n=1 Tax=Fructobacillus ficulneus TaxID=157463 RepID=A0A0K8MJF6_9LACO|nr:cupin domain-containing protein [Fructobacillus ficulneus]GAP00319.1 cupin [Fructobacillus ficulneus]
MAKFDELAQGGIFGEGVENPYGQFFLGQTYLNQLTMTPDDQVGVGTVRFEPGARNNWHIHHDGYQILLVTDGQGWYQEEGKPAQALKAGDVVVTKEGVKHWHGAQADSWFEHIALTAGTPEWLEPVDDETYNKL